MHGHTNHRVTPTEAAHVAAHAEYGANQRRHPAFKVVDSITCKVDVFTVTEFRTWLESTGGEITYTTHIYESLLGTRWVPIMVIAMRREVLTLIPATPERHSPVQWSTVEDYDAFSGPWRSVQDADYEVIAVDIPAA